MICLFYNSIASSVLVCGISSWFEACDNKPLENKESKLQRQTCKITNGEGHALVEILSSVYDRKCISLITNIVNDKDHYLHNQITVLPHGHLGTMKCAAERMCKRREGIKHFYQLLLTLELLM